MSQLQSPAPPPASDLDDDALSQQVYASGVYASKGPQDRPNSSDSIFNESGGATLLAVTQDGDTYRTTFEIAVQLA